MPALIRILAGVEGFGVGNSGSCVMGAGRLLALVRVALGSLFLCEFAGSFHGVELAVEIPDCFELLFDPCFELEGIVPASPVLELFRRGLIAMGPIVLDEALAWGLRFFLM